MSKGDSDTLNTPTSITRRPSPLIPASDLIFDPTRPSETDWERILSQHTERLLLRFQKREAARSKSAPKPDIA